jgi:hypothetical protein
MPSILRDLYQSLCWQTKRVVWSPRVFPFRTQSDKTWRSRHANRLACFQVQQLGLLQVLAQYTFACRCFLSVSSLLITAVHVCYRPDAPRVDVRNTWCGHWERARCSPQCHLVRRRGQVNHWARGLYGYPLLRVRTAISLHDDGAERAACRIE